MSNAKRGKGVFLQAEQEYINKEKGYSFYKGVKFGVIRVFFAESGPNLLYFLVFEMGYFA